jgi:hypothetical protein
MTEHTVAFESAKVEVKSQHEEELAREKGRRFHKTKYRCIKMTENPGLSLLAQALPVLFLAVKAGLGEQSLV